MTMTAGTVFDDKFKDFLQTLEASKTKPIKQSDWISNATLIIIELASELRAAKVQLEELKAKSNSYSSITKTGIPQETSLERAQKLTMASLEVKEQSRIESNIIISGVAPSNKTTTDPKVHCEHDEVQVTEVLSSLGVTFSAKNKTRRIINKDKTAPTSLIQVSLDNNQQQTEILQKAKSLRSGKYSAIFINRELTKNESFVEYSLRKERNKKNEKLMWIAGKQRFDYSKAKGANQGKPYTWTIKTVDGARKVTQFWLTDTMIEGAVNLSSKDAQVDDEE